MIQPRQHLRFAGEAGEPVGIGRKGLQDLDATSRFNLLSMARQTTPMPPSPSFSAIS